VSVLGVSVFCFAPAAIFGAESPAASQQSRAQSPLAVAESLWKTALQNRLNDAQLAQAAGLLDHDDPFVRGLAEWAIALKVGMDNNGQQCAWPRPDPPEWFQRWSALSGEFLLEADYVRQAAVWNIHHDGKQLLASVKKIIRRAEGAAGEVLRTGAPEAQKLVDRQLALLKSIQDRLARQIEAAPGDLTAQRKLWLDARRAARPIVMANPAIDFTQIIFITRHAAHSHRNITGSQYPWIHKPGGDICVKIGLDPASSFRPVLRGQLGPGHVHGIDLWWDADRAVFAYARQTRWPPRWDTVSGDHVFLLRGDQEPTHLYEIRLDGTGLRQLTNHPYWSDLEPTYCANGDVVFASDRSGRSSECGRFSADHTVINLYVVTPDGRIRRLNDNKDIDRYAHSLDNGLIAYTRWEYQERHFLEVHSIWTMRPDGTMAVPVFKQHLSVPWGLRDTRSIPGSPRLVSIGTGHHTFAYGPVLIVDPRQGINAASAVQSVTPYVAPQEGPNVTARVPEGGVPDQGGLYQTPWALSERCFLVSYSYGRPPSDTAGGRNENGFAIYLIDVYGNKELIHRDLIYSCEFPMALRRRPRPPILPSTADPAQTAATCYVSDVYQGLEGIPRGTVKYIRILQRVGWPLDERIGAMRWIPGNAWEWHFGFWSWAPVRVIGTVPVEADGSAYFRVPADTSVYFQVLDEREMELRRMRSHVTFQPGEVRGCLGCHESRVNAPATVRQGSLATAKPPQTPTPPPWGSQRLLGYEWLIQPILDRRCVRCHGSERPDGNIDLSATRAADGFLQSFRTLFGLAPHEQSSHARPKPNRVLVACSDRFSNAAVSQPMQFGSHRSRLVQVLLTDELHRKEARLSPAEWTTLVTWVDANAPYYDRFFNKRPADGGQPRREVLLDLPAPFVSNTQPGVIVDSRSFRDAKCTISR